MTLISLSSLFLLGGCFPDPGKVEIRYTTGKPHYRFSRFFRENGQQSIKRSYEEFYKDGRPRFLIEFAQGQIHGAVRTWNQSGKLIEKFISLMVFYMVLIKSFFANGSPKLVGNYQEGKKHGVFEFIDEDGAILKEEYINGLADGEFISTYQNGFPSERSIYSKGNLVSQIKYNEEQIFSVYKQQIKDELIDFEIELHEEVFESNGNKKWHYALARNGPFKGKKIGYERYWYANGVLAEEAEWSNGQLNARRKWTVDKVLISLEKLVKDKVNKKIWYPTGSPKIETNLLRGKKHGLSSTWYDNGVLSSNENFSDGLREGLYEEFDKDGNLRVSINYSKGKKEGKAFLYYQNGKKREERSYKNDKFHGPLSLWYENGNPEQISSFKNGEKEGIWISYYDNGSKKAEVNYKYGSIQGQLKEFYPNGKLQRRVDYKRNLKDGVFEYFDSDGKLLEKSNYKRDQLHGVRTFYANTGNVIETYIYVKDKPHGQARMYYSSGHLKREISFLNGKLHNQLVDRYANGRKARSCNYNRGLKQGFCLYYDEKGQELFHKDKQLEIDAIFPCRFKLFAAIQIIIYHFYTFLNYSLTHFVDLIFTHLKAC